MASSIAAITMPRSIDFSRATASAICSSSSLLALTAAMALVSSRGIGFALDAPERAAEPLAALMGDRHLDFHQIAGVTFEIGTPHQRPVDTGRGNLQSVGPVDRIGDVEHRRQRPRDRLAIVDLHRSVG